MNLQRENHKIGGNIMSKILNGTAHQVIVFDRKDLIKRRSRNYLEKKNEFVEPIYTINSSFGDALGVHEITLGAGVQTDVGLTLKESLVNNGFLDVMPIDKINLREDILVVSSKYADVATRVLDYRLADILFTIDEPVKEKTDSGWKTVGCTSIRKANPFFSVFYYISDDANLMTKRLAYEYFRRNQNSLQPNEYEALRTLGCQVQQMNQQDQFQCF